MQNVHFTPAEIARLISVNESTIKRWVDKGILPAQKTAGGHRRIRKEDLSTFVGAHKNLSDRSYILKKLNDDSEEVTYDEYYELLLGRRYDAARRVLHAAYLSGLSIVEIIERIVTPTLVLVGDGWHNGLLSIDSEHRITFVIRQHLIGLEELVGSSKKSLKKKRFHLACVPGDNHELALHLLSLTLRSFGHSTELLGINIQIKDLGHAIEGYKPDVLCLSKVFSEQPMKTTYITSLALLLKKSKVQLLIGGSGWTKKEIARVKKYIPKTHLCSSLSELGKI